MKFNNFTDGAQLRIKTNVFGSHNVLVTPATAKMWLDTHVRNRDIQRVSMRGYRADMLDGRWAFDGKPIAFDYDGHLIDGRNRMTALADIVIPQFQLPFVVQVGLPPEAQDTMDTGARRSAGQQLGLKGIPNGTNITAGVRLMWKWEREELFTRSVDATSITDSSLVAWIIEHEDAARQAMSQLARMRRIGLKPAAGLAMTLRLGPELFGEAKAMFTEMDTLENLPAGSPTAALAKRIARVRRDHELTMTDIDHLAFLIQCWNSWVSGDKRIKYQRPSGGWGIYNFPRLDA